MAIVHGALCVDSGPGQGTTLRAEMPLPAPAAATGRAVTGPAATAVAVNGTGAWHG
jgi:hypothetical protein